jgi:hypothetical protein
MVISLAETAIASAQTVGLRRFIPRCAISIHQLTKNGSLAICVKRFEAAV